MVPFLSFPPNLSQVAAAGLFFLFFFDAAEVNIWLAHNESVFEGFLASLMD